MSHIVIGVPKIVLKFLNRIHDVETNIADLIILAVRFGVDVSPQLWLNDLTYEWVSTTNVVLYIIDKFFANGYQLGDQA